MATAVKEIRLWPRGAQIASLHQRLLAPLPARHEQLGLTGIDRIKNNRSALNLLNAIQRYLIEVVIMILDYNSAPGGHGPVKAIKLTRLVRLLAFAGLGVVFATLFASCGGGTENNASSIVPPANVSNQSIEESLKFDSRVQDFDTDGDKLTVNVNDSWMKSPPGLKQRTVDGWLAGWKAERANDGGSGPKGLTVVVKYDGEDVATATPGQGIKIIDKLKPKSDE